MRLIFEFMLLIVLAAITVQQQSNSQQSSQFHLNQQQPLASSIQLLSNNVLDANVFNSLLNQISASASHPAQKLPSKSSKSSTSPHIPKQFILSHIKNFTNLERIIHKGTASHAKPMAIKHLKQYQKAIKIVLGVTQTLGSCYESPPITMGISMDKLMGTWYMDKINDYIPTGSACQISRYLATGHKTFDKKITFVNNGNKHSINANGTFFRPGIMVVDRMINNEVQRISYSILGTDYRNYLLGFICLPNHPNPVYTLETRTMKPQNKTLWRPYEIMTRADINVKNLMCWEKISFSDASVKSKTNELVGDFVSLFHKSLMPKYVNSIPSKA